MDGLGFFVFLGPKTPSAANQNALFLHHKKAHEIWTIKEPDTDIVQCGAAPPDCATSVFVDAFSFSRMPPLQWTEKRTPL